MEHAFYYHEQYFLLPDGYNSLDELRAAVPVTVRALPLLEDNHVPGAVVQKGICIAPFFMKGYVEEPAEVTIDIPSDLYPVEVERLTQEEYSARLRALILERCPGCTNYKPLSDRIQSLNGHYEEMSLLGTCFFRCESKPSPRVFLNHLHALGGNWVRDPASARKPDLHLYCFKLWYLTYEAAEWEDDTHGTLILHHKKDLMLSVLTEVLARYSALPDFNGFRVRDAEPYTFTRGDLDTLLSNRKGYFVKAAKRHGLSVMLLHFDTARRPDVLRSLSWLTENLRMTPLCRLEDGEAFLVTDTCAVLKALHFRSPELSACGVTAEVYDQYAIRNYTIGYRMEMTSRPYPEG